MELPVEEWIEAKLIDAETREQVKEFYDKRDPRNSKKPG